MTTVQEVYEKYLWGNVAPITPLEQLGGKSFHLKDGNLIKTFVGMDSHGNIWKGNPLVFEQYNKDSELIFRNRLYQDGRTF
jgi:hypothetical protein